LQLTVLFKQIFNFSAIVEAMVLRKLIFENLLTSV
jgi:hypothetical protein